MNLTKKMCLFAILATIIWGAKFALSAIPNVEPVSLLLTVFTMCFGLESLYIMTIYVLLDILLYGFGMWTVGYLYIWAILILAVHFIWKETHNYLYIIVAVGLFGFIFGALYIPMYLTMGGIKMAIGWWITGIMYDIIHGVANFIIAYFLLKPTYQFCENLKNKYGFNRL